MTNTVVKNIPRLTRFCDHKHISRVVAENKLLSLSIKLPVACNLKCRYCYSEIKRGDMGYGEILDILTQAQRLGVRSLSVIGEGEPFLYKDKVEHKNIFDLIKDVNCLGINVIIFTNNTLIDKKTAQLLHDLDVAIVCKLNSLCADTQDFLSGVNGSFNAITTGLSCLEEAGFAKSKQSRLSLHTVICRQNYHEIPDMWVYCRERNIIPYFQVFVPPNNRNTKHVHELFVKSSKVRELFHALAAIDRKRFGYVWDPDYTYPIVGLGCSVIKTGCCINSNAKVQMCGYVQEIVGDLRKDKLADMLCSDEIKKIRRYCYYSMSGQETHFYGCRALTFNMTHNKFAPDPFFWKS